MIFYLSICVIIDTSCVVLRAMFVIRVSIELPHHLPKRQLYVFLYTLEAEAFAVVVKDCI